MNRTSLALALLALVFLAAGPALAQASDREYTAQATVVAQDSDSKTMIRQAATLKALRLAVEQAGVLVESETLVQGTQVVRDEIRQRALGRLRARVVAEDYSLVDDCLAVTVHVRAWVMAETPAPMAELTDDLHTRFQAVIDRHKPTAPAQPGR